MGGTVKLAKTDMLPLPDLALSGREVPMLGVAITRVTQGGGVVVVGIDSSAEGDNSIDVAQEKEADP